MTITFSCEQCGHAFSVGEELIGKRIRCRKCRGEMRVPEDSDDDVQTLEIEVCCPGCQRVRVMSDEFAGKRVRCRCGTTFIAGEEMPSAPPPPPAAMDRALFEQLPEVEQTALADIAVSLHGTQRGSPAAAGPGQMQRRERELELLQDAAEAVRAEEAERERSSGPRSAHYIVMAFVFFGIGAIWIVICTLFPRPLFIIGALAFFIAGTASLAIGMSGSAG